MNVKTTRLVTILFIVLLGTKCLVGNEPLPRKVSLTNWLLYYYEKTSDYRFTRVLPFYSYKTSPHRMTDKFWLWPLLVGYEVAKNPAPTTFLHGNSFQWYNIPLFSLGSSQVALTENLQTSTMVSFLLMTYFEERQLQNNYLERNWYSLPLLSYYQSKTLWQKESEIINTNWGTPMFSVSDMRIVFQQQIFPVYDWSLAPLPILGKDNLHLIRHARWGRDHLIKLFALDNFAVFCAHSTFSQYPGARYHNFVRREITEEYQLQQLFAPLVTYPKNRLGVLSPFFMVETSPVGLMSWQLLPLFYYIGEGAQSYFHFLPLGLEISSQGVGFSFRAKLFPLLYHDDTYGRWDILWPLAQYNTQRDNWQFKLRFLFDYRYQITSKRKTCIDMHMVEGFAFSYRSENNDTSLEILPGGVLFKYHRQPRRYQWHVLGCGYLETSHMKYLQAFFIKIPLGSKK